MALHVRRHVLGRRAGHTLGFLRRCCRKSTVRGDLRCYFKNRILTEKVAPVRKLLLACFGCVAVLAGSPAHAADLGTRPVYKAPPPIAPLPLLSWTGCYLGANVGFGWAPKRWSDDGIEFASHTATGVVGGGQIGCDYQTGPWVFGIQGMFDGSGMKGDSHRVLGALGPNVTDETRVPWFATLTGRIGYSVGPMFLVYAKGGAAWVRDRHDECCLPPAPVVARDDGFARVTRSGWTVGGGLEYMFLPSWSVFLEYDFLGFGTRSVTFAPTGPTTGPFAYDIRQNVQTVLVGLNYRFGWGKGKAPVVARY